MSNVAIEKTIDNNSCKNFCENLKKKLKKTCSGVLFLGKLQFIPYTIWFPGVFKA